MINSLKLFKSLHKNLMLPLLNNLQAQPKIFKLHKKKIIKCLFNFEIRARLVCRELKKKYLIF